MTARPTLTLPTALLTKPLAQNAAQGIDVHCDYVIVSQNVVVNAFMGMKAMPGSRNVLVTGNQFVENSLRAIGLMPTASPQRQDDG